MSSLVNHGSKIECTFGTVPAVLAVLPGAQIVNAASTLAANVSAFAPTTNIPPFGQCKSLTNPLNASYTQTKVYAVCLPAVTKPWTTGCIATKINGQYALNSGCKCACTWGGEISITASNATKINVG